MFRDTPKFVSHVRRWIGRSRVSAKGVLLERLSRISLRRGKEWVEDGDGE